MTPEEMVRRIMQNIEAANSAINGPCGFVLHTTDHATFVCRSQDRYWLASPLLGDIVVQRTYRSARTMKRRWNDCLPDDDEGRQVVISLRREALEGYIGWQQAMLDALLEMGVRRLRRIPLDA
jgi:hypothetical protein